MTRPNLELENRGKDLVTSMKLGLVSMVRSFAIDSFLTELCGC